MFFEFSKLGVKPNEVRGSEHKKWDPSPVSVSSLDDFVTRILRFGD
jgi:hypothetical protein